MTFLTGRILFNPVRQKLKNLPAQLREVEPQILDDLAGALLNEIRRTAPKKTGKYRKSWTIGVKTDKKIEIFTPQGFLYVLLEFQGGRPHEIRGNPILRFEIDGKVFFRHKVDHPGFAAIPHVRPAIAKIMRTAGPAIIEKRLKVF